MYNGIHSHSSPNNNNSPYLTVTTPENKSYEDKSLTVTSRKYELKECNVYLLVEGERDVFDARCLREITLFYVYRSFVLVASL